MPSMVTTTEVSGGRFPRPALSKSSTASATQHSAYMARQMFRGTVARAAWGDFYWGSRGEQSKLLLLLLLSLLELQLFAWRNCGQPREWQDTLAAATCSLLNNAVKLRSSSASATTPRWCLHAAPSWYCTIHRTAHECERDRARSQA